MRYSDLELVAQQIANEFNGSCVSVDLAALLIGFVERPTLTNAVLLVERQPEFLAVFALSDRRLPELTQEPF